MRCPFCIENRRKSDMVFSQQGHLIYIINGNKNIIPNTNQKKTDTDL